MACLAPQTPFRLSFAIAKISDQPHYPFSPSLSNTSLENHKQSPSFHFLTVTSVTCRLGGLQLPRVAKTTLKKSTDDLTALRTAQQLCGRLHWGATLRFVSRVRRPPLVPAQHAPRPRMVQNHRARSLAPSLRVSCLSIPHLDWLYTQRLNLNLRHCLQHRLHLR